MAHALLLALWLTAPAPPGCRAQAQAAVTDLLTHFWTGEPATGQIVNTWHGYAEVPLPDARGALWERAMLYLTLADAWRLTSDETVRQRLAADWSRTKRLYTPRQLEACGQRSGTNWAADDAGWSALMYLAAHRATGDPEALARARGLVKAAFDRWGDDRLGGGLWYSDKRDVKSLYQTALVLAALETGDPDLGARALACYDWLEAHLRRPDGLYWCDLDAAGPRGANRPDDIHEAGSVVFLGGAMAMGVLHARRFAATGDDQYRLRAIRCAEAVRRKLTTAEGVLIDDRDAWTNGVFAGDWAREVLILPGLGPEPAAVLRATAESIATRARTAEGYYGASWSGPAEGEGSAWWRGGSRPRQIMTSASAVHFIVAAALAPAAGPGP
jgi:hypothetical protein